MKINPIITFFITAIILMSNSILSQEIKRDKCGTLDQISQEESLKRLGKNWGYGFDNLLNDIVNWVQSEYVELDDIGMSVQNRALWRLTITNFDIDDENKNHISIHARTHPNEVHSTWVTNEIIEFLLSENTDAAILRDNCVFHIIPMYNPDGVELEYPRENANGIDLESNWYSSNIQPEVIALRASFQEYMDTGKNIEIALNMHSAVACKRYFVYHHENGTSIPFTQMEQEYINLVKSYYDEGIEPWYYYISWVNGTPYLYPESWWWENYQEQVLALTYEDMNCASAGNYDITALAILKGSADFLGIEIVGMEEIIAVDLNVLGQNYPNPASREMIYTTFPLQLQVFQNYTACIYDYSGKKIRSWDSKYLNNHINELKVDISSLKQGVYYLQLVSDKKVEGKKFIIQ